MNERNTCLNVLLQVFGQEKKLNDALKEALSCEDFDSRDRRFIRRLSFGTVERYETLLAVLKKLSSVKPEKMRPQIRLILLMSLYELLYMDTKDYAVISEAMKLAEKRGFSRLKGFVNGNLREAVRSKEHLFSGLTEREKLSCPEDLYQKLVFWYGEKEAIRILEAFLLEEEGLGVRRIVSGSDKKTFESLLEKDSAEAVESILGDPCLFLSFNGSLAELSVFQKGLVYVQDMSSQLDAFVLKDLTSAGSFLKVLDVCASPGGKSICISDDTEKKADILACDISEKKTDLIRENVYRCGLQNIRTAVRDASVVEPSYEEAFDLVIADVPCSGIGTIRKKPDIRFRITDRGLKETEQLQKAILENVSRYVRPGGTLLYSTCTLNPGENQEQTSAFLKLHPEFEAVPLLKLPDPIRCLSKDGRDLTVLPGKHNDGFYLCRMKRSLSRHME